MLFTGIGKENFAVVLLVAELKDLKVGELIVKARESRVPLGIISGLINVARGEKGLAVKRYSNCDKILKDSQELDGVDNLKVVLAMVYAEYKAYKSLSEERVISLSKAIEKYLEVVKGMKCNLSNYREYLVDVCMG